MYDTILVGTDGSTGANRAVAHALERAEANGADIHAIYVVDTGRYGEPALSSTELVVDSVEDWGREQLDAVVDRADDRGIGVVTRCVHGDPHAEIIAYADDVDADVIVLGHRGLTYGSSTHLGSVADRVVRNAGRPVLVV